MFGVLEFNTTVQESRALAEQALEKVPEIERLIVQAEERTNEALADLADAERDASASEWTARQTYNISQTLTQVQFLLTNVKLCSINTYELRR